MPFYAPAAKVGITNTWTANQIFEDDVKLLLGTGSDAEFYHDDADLTIDVNKGDIKVTIAGGDFAFQQATTISTSTSTLTLNPSGALSLTAATTITGTLDAESTGAIGNGRSVDTNEATLIVDRNYSTATGAYAQLRIGGDVITTDGNGWQAGLVTAGYSVTIETGNSHGNVAALELYGPTVTLTDGSVTNASAIYIGSAASGASDNYSLFVDAGVSRFDGQIVASGGILSNGKTQIDQTERVIDSSGAITVLRGYHRVDTYNNDSADDLDCIGGGVDGMMVTFVQDNAARNVTFKDSVDNLHLAGDFVMSDPKDTITLIYSSAFGWWQEVSRSNNQ
jgi:hypothetical protein